MKLTAVFQKVREGYIGFVEELPGQHPGPYAQASSPNLAEAVGLVLQVNRSLPEEVD